MKTFEEIQTEYTKSIGFSDWNDLLKHQLNQRLIHRDYYEVTKRYALEAMKADRQIIKEHFDDCEYADHVIDGINNLPIELK